MFIVIEGLDGSGKSTQIKKLQDFFQSRNHPYKYLHFPRTGSAVYGELIAKFLRGELGDINQVNPYLVALIYAGDRKDASPLINQWLREGYTVLIDRYVHSNIGYQCAKLSTVLDQKLLKDWILHLEYSYHKIPKPDVNLFLDVPFEFTQKKLTAGRQGTDRDYLNGNEDIHEKSIDFQHNVRKVYLDLLTSEPDFYMINCYDGEQKMLPPDDVFQKIIQKLDELHIVK